MVQETWVQSLGREDPLEREMANPLQYSCLENPMDRGAWWATAHGVARVGHDLVTKPPPPALLRKRSRSFMNIFTFNPLATTRNMATPRSKDSWEMLSLAGQPYAQQKPAGSNIKKKRDLGTKCSLLYLLHLKFHH